MPAIQALPCSASARQASTQLVQVPQKFLSTGFAQASCMSVNTVPRRTHDPNLRVMSWQWRPIQPIYVFQIKNEYVCFLKKFW
jgi:hypothetical protein